MKISNEKLIRINVKKYLITTYRNIFRLITHGFIPIDNFSKRGIIEEIKIQLS